MITFYKDMYSKEPHHTSVGTALSRIKEGKIKDVIQKIRSGDKSLKSSLPCVIFAGEIIGDRKDENVKTHSGFFVLDYDHVDIEQKKNQLRADPYIYACWVSPSGDGIKALVRCPKNTEKHSEYYDAFIQRYPELDTTSRNISRLCFESYDPDIYINPNSRIWDKTPIKKEVIRDRKERLKNKRNTRTLSIAVDMIRTAMDGEKHDSVLKAGRLVGGYVATGRLDEVESISLLEQEINARPTIKDKNSAIKTLKDGIEHGKRQPIHEIKRLERKQDFVKRSNGEYDFLADVEEMDEYEQAVIDGTLEMGLPTGLPELDKYFMFKKNTLVFFGGIDNVGKSFVLWYLAVLQAIFNGIKFTVFSAENRDGEVRKKLKEFYVGKKMVEMTQYEREKSTEFIDAHFKIMTSKKMYTWEDILMHAEVLFDEGWEFDCLIAEPYNAMDVPNDMNMHAHNVKALNLLRVFKENYSSVWICDHANSQAARDKDEEGYVKVPWKSGLDGGQMKSNKTDDFIMIHRLVNHPNKWNVTEIHVMKVKSRETGGDITPKDDPFYLVMNPDMCGYHQFNALDPVYNHWHGKKSESHKEIVERVKSIKANTSFDNETNINMDEVGETPPF